VRTLLKSIFKKLWGSTDFGWRTARIVILLCAGVVILLMAFEDRLIFFPAKYPEGFWSVENLPAGEGEIIPRIEDSYFKSADGVRLHGWYCTPQKKRAGEFVPVPSDMVLLWFHGNAGNISHRIDMICGLMELPVQVFIVDYRGYGRSEGSPSERGLYLDARGAWDYLTLERKIPASRIVVLGKSLGSAPAVDLASKVEPAGLIVQSGFTSAPDMAATILPFLPSALLRTKMDSINKIANVACPKLFIHSPVDEVVPYKLGRRLFDAAPAPKQFYEVARASHNETYIVGGKAYFQALRAFIDSCRPVSEP
jgi:fermentation-respiration switch protein FrsA (DUF1100 family)